MELACTIHIAHCGGEIHRHEELRGRPREHEVGAKDANDDVRVSAQRDRAPDDRDVGAEEPSPETVRQHSDMIDPAIFARRKRAAQRRLRAEDVEEVRRDAPTRNLFRRGPFCEGERSLARAGDPGERARRTRPVEILRGGDVATEVATRDIVLVDRDESIGLGEG